jgi:hypothetical protein
MVFITAVMGMDAMMISMLRAITHWNNNVT